MTIRGILLVLLGAFVAVAPFVGLPLAVLAWILPPVGLCVLAVGVSLRRRPPALPYDGPAA